LSRTGQQCRARSINRKQMPSVRQSREVIRRFL
jgi:hypothetical protein